MDATDLLLLRELEKGLPLIPEPFEEIGSQIGLSGEEVLKRIRILREDGIIRKYRARINQRRAGILANALVTWMPEDGREKDAGRILAGFPEVTHCYERTPVPGKWEYTHYTVHHGPDRETVFSEIRKIAESSGIREYQVLFSIGEFKRVPNVRISETGCEGQ